MTIPAMMMSMRETARTVSTLFCHTFWYICVASTKNGCFLFVYVPSLLGTINSIGMSWNHQPTFFPYTLFVFFLVSARLVCCPCDSMFAFFDRMITLNSQHYWPYPPQVDIVSAPNGRAPEWSRQHLNSHGSSVGFIAEICKEDLGITCT